MEYLFLDHDITESEENRCFIQSLKSFAESKQKQVYMIRHALGTSYSYDFHNAAVVLIPRYPIYFVNWGNEEEFLEYRGDFLEDLGYISDKYGYKKAIGRRRDWEKRLVRTETIARDTVIESFASEIRDPQEARVGQLLVSLLIGSINDVEKVGKEVPSNVLDAINRRIILYDSIQTEFIFQRSSKKVITIQGLAGTGKTELLLRKLKELYTDPKLKNAKIALTCHNRILAENLKTRIPQFFDFLKVDEQIRWNENLFVMRGWGSANANFSGVYSYLCAHYGIAFLQFGYGTSFDYVCKQMIEQLRNTDFVPCFDYMLIDESQDFPDSFFELCEMVTIKQVIIAGDVFQNIFDVSSDDHMVDYLLNKCYRTDPKTLIFAHAMGMGLLDSPLPDDYIRWLSDREWELCGYHISREKNQFMITRSPIQRFEDIDVSDIQNLVIKTERYEEYENKLIEIIDEIKTNHPTVRPDDIGIVFLENQTDHYKFVDRLESCVYEKYAWEINKGYESKKRKENTLFVSNINNVKGLEFPFVICLSKGKLSHNLQTRNALYMVLTRSFITSYFLVDTVNPPEKLAYMRQKLNEILTQGSLSVTEPSEEQKKEKEQNIIKARNINKSQKEIAEEYMNSKHIPSDKREKIHLTLPALLEDENNVSMIQNAIDHLIKILG